MRTPLRMYPLGTVSRSSQLHRVVWARDPGEEDVLLMVVALASRGLEPRLSNYCWPSRHVIATRFFLADQRFSSHPLMHSALHR